MALQIEMIDSDGGGSAESGVQYTLVYEVHNPDGLLGPNTACNSVGWNYGDGYLNAKEGEADDRARCVSITCDGAPSREGHSRTVTVSFRQLPAEEREKLENPFASIKESFKVVQDGELPLDYDINWRPIANRAGDKFSDVTEAQYSGVLKITKNFASPPMWILQYVGTVNADSFRGFPARTLKLIDIDDIVGEPHPAAGMIYPLTLHFSFKPQGHKKRVLNEGYRAKNDEGKLEHIYVNGEKTTEPMLLTGNGKKAPEGSSPVWLEFETSYPLPFGGIV